MEENLSEFLSSLSEPIGLQDLMHLQASNITSQHQCDEPDVHPSYTRGKH